MTHIRKHDRKFEPAKYLAISKCVKQQTKIKLVLVGLKQKCQLKND